MQLLPILDKPVNAICKNHLGEISSQQIKRIKTKETFLGWQWSGIYFNTYFTLEVISWEYLNQFKLNL